MHGLISLSGMQYGESYNFQSMSAFGGMEAGLRMDHKPTRSVLRGVVPFRLLVSALHMGQSIQI
jgi:hypothetical protein